MLLEKIIKYPTATFVASVVLDLAIFILISRNSANLFYGFGLPCLILPSFILGIWIIWLTRWIFFHLNRVLAYIIFNVWFILTLLITATTLISINAPYKTSNVSPVLSVTGYAFTIYLLGRFIWGLVTNRFRDTTIWNILQGDNKSSVADTAAIIGKYSNT